jgi:hypothetical protein
VTPRPGVFFQGRVPEQPSGFSDRQVLVQAEQRRLPAESSSLYTRLKIPSGSGYVLHANSLDTVTEVGSFCRRLLLNYDGSVAGASATGPGVRAGLADGCGSLAGDGYRLGRCGSSPCVVHAGGVRDVGGRLLSVSDH